MKKTYLLLSLTILTFTATLAQVTVTNPANTTPNLAATYGTLAAAVTALSGITSISGPVIITLNAGNPQTAPAGGYVIQFTATTTAANTITFQGSNNIITSSGSLTVGNINDAVIKLIGADYITIDGFALQENPANNTTGGASPQNTVTGNNMTEWGIALLHASVTNGAQNNTIQNNTISLDRNYRNTFGVYSNVNHSATSVFGSELITSVTGGNFGNKVYSNAISNVGYGIVFVGATNTLYMDNGNDIGGSSAATGNTITNWGATNATLSNFVFTITSSYCIYINHQINENVSYNTITSALISNTTLPMGGIFKNFSSGTPPLSSTSTINNNTITISSLNATSTMHAISNATTAPASATFSLTISNNSIVNCVISGASSTSSFTGIINTSAIGAVTITNNVIRGTTSTAATGGFTGIQNSGAVVNTININNNQVGNASGNAITYSVATTGTITGITNTGAAVTATVNLNNNSVYGITALSSGQITGVNNAGGSAGTVVNMNSDTLRNTVVSGVAATSSLLGMSNSNDVASLNMINNVIYGNTLSSTTGFFQGVRNTGAVVTTLNMNNNKLGIVGSGAVTFTAATSQNFNCIYNTSAAATATVNMNNNSVDGISVVTTGTFNTILNNATLAAVANMNNNQLGTVTGTFITFNGAQTSNFTALNSGAGSGTATTSIQNNDIRGIVHSIASSCTEYYIYSNAANLSHTVANNTFTNMNVNTTGNVYLIYDNTTKAAGQTFTYNNNSIVTGFTKSGAGNSFNGFSSVGFSVNGSITNITNNNFSDVTLTGATFFYGINAQDGESNINGPAETITGNIINKINGSTSFGIGINVDYCAGLTCSANTVSTISCDGSIVGIRYGNNNGVGTQTYSSNIISSLASLSAGAVGIIGVNTSIPTVNISSNTITGLSAGGASDNVSGIYIINGATVNINDNIIDTLSGSGTTSPVAHGIAVLGGTTVNVYRNKIHTISETGIFSSASPAVNGILFSGGTTVTAYNNFVANLSANDADIEDAIRGISITSNTDNTNYNLYYNSIYMNAFPGSANSGTSGIFHRTDIATTAALNMIDNIIVNTSKALGTGLTVAFRRSGAALNNFVTTSDYNLFYAGTPLPTKLIYYDGTNSDQTLAAYQTRVSTRDANSISLMPTFVSSTDLHLTSANCRIDGRGTPIGSVTTDIDAAARNATTPDMGADEFTATTSTSLAGVAGSAVCEDRIIAVTGTTYTSNACDLIARVLPSGADPVTGKVNVCVTLDATQQTFNGDPYVQRHFDIEPTTSNQTSTSATITLYFTDAEFVLYNSNNPVQPSLPTNGAGNTVANRNNVKVTQFHGAATTSPSSPGNYPGVRELITPGAANVFWNGTYWEVTFTVMGFSGFYVHTNNYNAPLPITVNYLTGYKQGSNHLLNWKVTCNSTPRATMTLERSADARNYTGINTITADAARCNQPFDYTDANPLAGMNYYRLKIVDADGKVTYSTTVALLNAVKGFDIISIAPNPVVTDNFKLNVASAQAGKMEISIFDMQGRLVNRQSILVIAGFNSLPVQVNDLSAGTYTIRAAMAGEQSNMIRFVKQ